MPQVGRFERWHIDVLGPLTKTPEGYEYILLVVDTFSRWCEGFAMKTQSAKEIAEHLYSGVITRYGCPRVLFSDRGQPFMSKIVTAMCEILQISMHHSTYHPNTNGTVERQNHTLAQSLRTYCQDGHGKWPSLIPGILMAFRRSVSSATGFSPFHMFFGEEMKPSFDIALQPKEFLPQDTKDYINQFISNLKIAHRIASQNEAVQKDKDKIRHDQTAKVQRFAIGDLVLLKTHKFPKGQSRKLCDKASGPYRIEEIGPNYTYAIRRQSDLKKSASLINATNLQLYTHPDPIRQKLSAEPTQDNPNNSDTESETDDWKLTMWLQHRIYLPLPHPNLIPLSNISCRKSSEDDTREVVGKCKSDGLMSLFLGNQTDALMTIC